MKLSLLSEGQPNDPWDEFVKAAADSVGQKLAPMTQNLQKKQAIPSYPETGDDGTKGQLPYRSGNQDTPLKPRHRKYFNAPLGATQGKIGWGQPLGSWPYRKHIKT